MAQTQLIKDVADATAATAGLGTGAGAVWGVISPALATVVGVLSIIALVYSIRLRRREWERGKDG